DERHETTAILLGCEVGREGDGDRQARAESQPREKPGYRELRSRVDERGQQREHAERQHRTQENGLAPRAIAGQPGGERSDHQANVGRGQDRRERGRRQMPRIDQRRDRVAYRRQVVAFEEQHDAAQGGDPPPHVRRRRGGGYFHSRLGAVIRYAVSMSSAITVQFGRPLSRMPTHPLGPTYGGLKNRFGFAWISWSWSKGVALHQIAGHPRPW